MTCYVEIQLGVPYTLCAQPKSMPKHDLSYRLYADGNWIKGPTLRAGTLNPSIQVSDKAIDAFTSKILQFSNLELTDDDEDCVTDNNYLMKLGELEFRMTGGRLGLPVPATFSTSAVKDDAKVHEKTKKATLLGAKSVLGAAKPSNNSNQVQFFDDYSLPSHNVIFKYRTRQALILLKIIDDKASVEENAPPATSAAASSSNVKVEKKRKSDANEKEKEVVDLSGEDVKPFKKKSRPSDVDKSKAGGSRATAIDLTNL